MIWAINLGKDRMIVREGIASTLIVKDILELRDHEDELVGVYSLRNILGASKISDLDSFDEEEVLDNSHIQS